MQNKNCISSSCLIKYTSSFTESMPDHIYDGAMPQLWKKNTISDGGSTAMQKSVWDGRTGSYLESKSP